MDASFGYTRKGIINKYELKERLGFKRLPLLNYGVLEEQQAIFDQQNEVLNHAKECALCNKDICDSTCPLNGRNFAEESTLKQNPLIRKSRKIADKKFQNLSASSSDKKEYEALPLLENKKLRRHRGVKPKYKSMKRMLQEQRGELESMQAKESYKLPQDLLNFVPKKGRLVKIWYQNRLKNSSNKSWGFRWKEFKGTSPAPKGYSEVKQSYDEWASSDIMKTAVTTTTVSKCPVQIFLTLLPSPYSDNIDESDENNQVEDTKSVILDEADFCRCCKTSPCLELNKCLMSKNFVYVDSNNRILHKKYIGQEKLKKLNKKSKRVRRNSELAQSCRMFTEVCRGEGHCSVCAEGESYPTTLAQNMDHMIENSPTKLRYKHATRLNKSPISFKGMSRLAIAMDKFQTISQVPEREKTKFQQENNPIKHVGEKWTRIKELFEISLRSEHSQERIEAAKQLGLLQCSDPAVFHALKMAIVEDTEERVQYESAKSLILLGCLENELLQIIVDYLIVGNQEVRLDLLKCLCDAKGIAFINKSMPACRELQNVLSHLCKNEDHRDPVGFEAAITFGKICVKNEIAVAKMTAFLQTSSDPHKKATALRIIVKQFNESNDTLVKSVINQCTHSPVWSYRTEAAQLLQHMGRKSTCQTPDMENLVYTTLEQMLWDDPMELIRLEAAKTLMTLNMYQRAAESVIKRLASYDQTTRAHAITSLGTLGIKQTKVLRQLGEMLDLDPSDLVRREIIRTFGVLQVTDKNIIRLLKEREKTEGMLATEAKKVIQRLGGEPSP